MPYMTHFAHLRYEEFDSSEAKALLPFIDAVSILSMTERPRTLQVGTSLSGLKLLVYEASSY